MEEESEVHFAMLRETLFDVGPGKLQTWFWIGSRTFG
jgi:hypothetical protein